MFVYTVGIEGADLKYESLFQIFAAFRVPPLSNERPQMAMCEVECCGKEKCRATGINEPFSFN